MPARPPLRRVCPSHSPRVLGVASPQRHGGPQGPRTPPALQWARHTRVLSVPSSHWAGGLIWTRPCLGRGGQTDTDMQRAVATQPPPPVSQREVSGPGAHRQLTFWGWPRHPHCLRSETRLGESGAGPAVPASGGRHFPSACPARPRPRQPCAPHGPLSVLKLQCPHRGCPYRSRGTCRMGSSEGAQGQTLEAP